MGNLQVRVSPDALPHVISAFIPEDAAPNATLEMVVILHDQNLPTREFAEYFALIDRVYGRLITNNRLRSYSRNRRRLLISNIHHSELEVVFSAWYHIQEALPFVVMMLFLKALPSFIRSASEGIKSLAEAYKSYEEGRLTSTKRKTIEQALSQDASFNKLPEIERARLMSVVESLFESEQKKLAGPAVFAQRQVKDVVLRVKGSDLFPFQSIDEYNEYMEKHRQR